MPVRTRERVVVTADAAARALRALEAGPDRDSLRRARVALHRLRGALAAAGGRRALRGELRWLSSGLGELRDLDVVAGRVAGGGRGRRGRGHGGRGHEGRGHEGDPGRVELEARLRAERCEVAAASGEMLGSARYLALLGRVEDLASSSGRTSAGRRRTRARLGREARRYERVERKLGRHPTTAELHDLRRRARRLRYAAEAAVAAGTGATAAARLASRAAAVQAALGAHHDTIVAEAWLTAAALRAAPAGSFAAGLAVATERAAGRAAAVAARPARRALRAEIRRAR